MTTQPKVQKSARLPRGALDRETVVAAALEIADRDGLSGVTMARVAEALGGSPMSLYRHLSDKQELLDAVADLALSEVPAHRPGRTALAGAPRGVRDGVPAQRVAAPGPHRDPSSRTTSEARVRPPSGST